MEVMLMSMTAISAIWVLSCLIIPANQKAQIDTGLKRKALTSPLAIFETAICPVRLDVEFKLELHLELQNVNIAI